MIIKQVTLENFGLYQGCHTIELGRELPKRSVTLIGGLNGRGKTTLLDSITLGLYGRRALKYLQDERIKYSSYLENHINKSVRIGTETSITIILEAENCGETIKIRRHWKKPYKTEAEERFEAFRNEVFDEYLSKNWDYFVEEILPLNISRFFFFDGEKIAQIADDDSFEGVKDSIRSLLGLTTIDQLVADMLRISKKFTATTSPDKAREVMQRLHEIQERIEACNEQGKEATARAGHYQQAIIRAQSEYEVQQDQFWKNGGNLGLEREEILRTKQLYSDRLVDDESEARDYLQDASMPFLVCRELLTRTYNRALAGERAQIRVVSHSIIKQLREMVQNNNYSEELRRAIIGFIDQATKQIDDDCDFSPEPFSLSPTASAQLRMLVENSTDTMSKVCKLLNSINMLKGKQAQLEAHLSREVNESDAHDNWEAMQRLNHVIMENEIKRRIELEQVTRLEREIDILQKQLNRQLVENMKNEQNQDEALRVVRYANIVSATMSEFKRKLQAKKVLDLQNKILECFQFMVQKGSVIKGIEIDPDTLDMKLIDYAGGELLKAQLSAGEKQLFAVSILWGLAQCSGYDTPVIIDTPLGRLDSLHRINFIERYIPYASKQVVVLSTDEEINGKYYDMLRPYISALYTLEYNDATKSTSILRGYFGGNAV